MATPHVECPDPPHRNKSWSKSQPHWPDRLCFYKCPPDILSLSLGVVYPNLHLESYHFGQIPLCLQLDHWEFHPGLATTSIFLFVIIDLPGWANQINNPSAQKYFSLPFLPATPSFLSRTLERLWELTRCPSQALNSPRTLLPQLQKTRTLSGVPC